MFQSGCPTLKSLGLYDFILDHSYLQFLTSVNADSEESVLPNLSPLGLFSQPWVNLTSITFADANVETFRAFLDVVNDGKLLNLVELRMSARIGEDVDFGILQPEQVPKLKSLTLAQVVTFSTKLQQLVHQIAQWKLQYLNLIYNPGISGNLSLCLSHTLPALKSLILRKCKLQSHDMVSLALANVQGKFPELDI